MSRPLAQGLWEVGKPCNVGLKPSKNKPSKRALYAQGMNLNMTNTTLSKTHLFFPSSKQNRRQNKVGAISGDIYNATDTKDRGTFSWWLFLVGLLEAHPFAASCIFVLGLCHLSRVVEFEHTFHPLPLQFFQHSLH